MKVYTFDGVEWAFVAFGSTQPPRPPLPKFDPVVVTRRDTGFIELVLDQTTYFKCTHGKPIRADDPDAIVYGPCPYSLFVALKTLFDMK